jgi:hypothetical protein
VKVLRLLVAVGALVLMAVVGSPLVAQQPSDTPPPGNDAHTSIVTVVVVRHSETDLTAPTLPLTVLGRQRADLLIQTFRDVKFTNIFASHTTRTRQTAEPVAAAQKLPVVQLPTPGSMLNGEPVTDATSRQAAIEPIANAVLRLPAGSVALAALNSDNIYGFMNRLGVPVGAAEQPCAVGTMCVPCLTNACFPATDFDRVWDLVLEAGRAKPLAMIESRYGVGWTAAASR